MMNREEAYDAMRDGKYIYSDKYSTGAYCYQDKTTMFLMYQPKDYSRSPERVSNAMDTMYEPFKTMSQDTTGPKKRNKIKVYKVVK